MIMYVEWNGGNDDESMISSAGAKGTSGSGTRRPLHVRCVSKRQDKAGRAIMKHAMHRKRHLGVGTVT